MDNLTLIDKTYLQALEELEYHLHLNKNKEGQSYEIPFRCFSSLPIKDSKDLYGIAEYLQENEIDLKITFDLVNDHPDQFVDELHQNSEDVTLAVLKTGDINETLNKIKNLIVNIKGDKEESKNPLKIFFYTDLGKLVFNDNDIIFLEGKQKDLANCLVNEGKHVRVGLGDIYDYMKITNEDFQTFKKGSQQFKAYSDVVRQSANEINRKAERYITLKGKLIDYKNNEYWLECQIDKDR
jgi:hypothetical protein